MFSSSTSNTLMSPFPPYYFPSSSPYNQPQPQPQPPPPPPPIPPLIPNQNDNLFLHQNYQYDHLFSLANAQIPESTLINLGVISNTTTTTTANIMTGTTTGSTKQEFIINGGGNRRLAPKFFPRKPGAVATKKDRHSKIYTAQGLRDRRVRLSIDIAREFFDLHDMLGFDKASRTLEWLLTKSRKAIKELSRSKLRTSTTTKISSTTLSSTDAANSDQCEQAMYEVNELVAAADHDINVPKRKVSKEKLIDAETLSEATLISLLAKESRAKARARARARTKEKRHNNSCTTTTSTTAYNNNNNNNNNTIRSSNYSNNMEKFTSSSGGSSSHQISNHHQLLIRTVLLNQLDHQRDIDHQTQRLTPNLFEEKGLLVRMDTNHDHHQDDDDDDQEEEPVVMIKRKLYDHSDDHEGQFCGIPSKGGASNNVIYSSSPSLLVTQNWDNNNNISTASPHPAAASFCLPT